MDKSKVTRVLWPMVYLCILPLLLSWTNINRFFVYETYDITKY